MPSTTYFNLGEKSKKPEFSFQSWWGTYHSIVEFKIHRTAGNWTILKCNQAAAFSAKTAVRAGWRVITLVSVIFNLPHKVVAYLRGLILSKPCRKPLLAHINKFVPTPRSSALTWGVNFKALSHFVPFVHFQELLWWTEWTGCQPVPWFLSS